MHVLPKVTLFLKVLCLMGVELKMNTYVMTVWTVWETGNVQPDLRSIVLNEEGR